MGKSILYLMIFFAVMTRVEALLAEPSRRVVSLDGTWQIAEGSMTNVPVAFDRMVPVPGLVDMAKPPFVQPWTKGGWRPQKDPRRDAYWYRRSFELTTPVPVVARLKVNKAMFGTKVWLNGVCVGEHLPCFTPGWFDVRSALKTGKNELLIRIGADNAGLDGQVAEGTDGEKKRFIAGIFDSVSLILSGTPHIENVQVAPDIINQQAKVRVYLDGSKDTPVEIEIREAKSGALAGKAAGNGSDFVVPIKNCRLWSPEDPFLYRVTVRTSGDEFTTRFGMREFHFDTQTHQAVLNGRPYFMRGSNITLYRFFEDSERGALPWNEAWVRKLHKKIKGMHWNCLRYCIGFPPEKWYEIADETGLLIDDEFPIWYGGVSNSWPKNLTSDEVATEYREWMRERWNHPSVVIWDACNETSNPKTGQAINAVRGLDLSQRPWDNGWGRPCAPGDMLESHPYHFNHVPLKHLGKQDWSAEFGNAYVRNVSNKYATVINEYAWIWLNRDGTPTTLTKQIYDRRLGPNATPAQRFHMQATWLAADTEMWRTHRKVAAVMHFTALGYSRPDGQTCDNWTKGGVATLEWEPEFYRYVRDAFAPVGLMIDSVAPAHTAGKTVTFPVVLINDLYKPWAGPVMLRLKQGNRVVTKLRQAGQVPALGRTTLTFDLKMPDTLGAYTLEAELRGADGQPVHSTRDITIQAPRPPSLTEHCTATASSVARPSLRAENAVDDDEDTYWSSAFQDDAWLSVDLGAVKRVSRVNILWENAYAKSFLVQVSKDGIKWNTVYQTDAGEGGLSEIKFNPVEVRHVRIICTKRATKWGNAIRELDIQP